MFYRLYKAVKYFYQSPAPYNLSNYQYFLQPKEGFKIFQHHLEQLFIFNHTFDFVRAFEKDTFYFLEDHLYYQYPSPYSDTKIREVTFVLEEIKDFQFETYLTHSSDFTRLIVKEILKEKELK